jgi:hypothetical protein
VDAVCHLRQELVGQRKQLGHARIGQPVEDEPAARLALDEPAVQ